MEKVVFDVDTEAPVVDGDDSVCWAETVLLYNQMIAADRQ